MEILIHFWHFASQLIRCALNLDIDMFRHFIKKKKKNSLHNLLWNLDDHHKLQTSLYFSINPLSYNYLLFLDLFVYFQTDQSLCRVRHKSAQACLSPPPVRPLHSAFIATPAEAVCDLEAELPPFMSLNQSQSCGVGWSQGYSDNKSFSKSGKDPQTKL